MLSKLKEVLCNYSEEQELKKIKHTCCTNIDLKVLDFDEISRYIGLLLG